MLLVQNISLGWGKEERGAEYARVRAGFPMAYPVESKPFSGEVVEHTLSFWQKGMEFTDLMQKTRSRWGWQCYSCLKELNLANIVITAREDSAPLEVTFFYDEHRSGKPFRRGHNKDYQNIESPFYRKDCLNETAFTLEEGQYGRILWNERKTDYDTGEWYYQLHILNLYHLRDRVLKSDIFMARSPDFEYKQMADLR